MNIIIFIFGKKHSTQEHKSLMYTTKKQTFKKSAEVMFIYIQDLP